MQPGKKILSEETTSKLCICETIIINPEMREHAKNKEELKNQFISMKFL